MQIETASLVNMASWWARVAHHRGGRVQATADAHHIDAHGPNVVMNRSVPLRSGLSGADVAGEVRAHFDVGTGGPFSVFDPDGGLRLDAHGFTRQAGLPHMVLDRPTGSPTHPVRRITAADDLAAAEGLVRGAFTFAGWDDSPFLRVAEQDGTVAVFLLDDELGPAATALSHDHAGVTGVYLVGTRADARGKGYGEAVTLAAATAFGDQPSTLQASALGEPVYRRMGYRTFADLVVWSSTRNPVSAGTGAA